MHPSCNSRGRIEVGFTVVDCAGQKGALQTRRRAMRIVRRAEEERLAQEWRIIVDVHEFQRLAVEAVDRIDEKAGLNRDAQLAISQLVEELGELAKEANREKLRNQKPELEDLEDEFADVFLQLCKLADLFGVDLEKAVSNKIAALKKRHRLD